MFGTKSHDVGVVGAGPVGLVSALLLHKAGADVVVLESEPSTEARSYALALSADALAVINECGLLEIVMKQGLALDSMQFHGLRQEVLGTIDFSQYDQDYPHLIVLGQDQLETLLEEALIARGVPILRNHRVSRVEQDDSGVKLFVDELDECLTGYAVVRMDWQVVRQHEFNCRYVIGADGHNSIVRRSLRLDFPTFDRSQQFAVFEFISDWQADSSVHVVLRDGLTSVLWPLPRGGCRWSFELQDSPHSGRRQLDVDRLKGFIAYRAPWFEGSVEHLYWSTTVTFDKRLVNSFGSKRVWLAGDAAHVTGPVGVQSMNMGILEAHNLTDLLADCLKGKRKTEDLELYGREALANWSLLNGSGARVTAGPQVCKELLPFLNRFVQFMPGKPLAQQRLVQQLDVFIS